MPPGACRLLTGFASVQVSVWLQLPLSSLLSSQQTGCLAVLDREIDVEKS